MSLPLNTLSLEPIMSEFIVPEKSHVLEDYSINPVSGKLIRAYYDHADETIKYIEDMIVKTVFTMSNISAMSFTLDLNERAICVYVKNNSTWMYWYDSNIGQMIHTEYGTEYLTPQIAIDEQRHQNANNADIIFAYVKNKQLYIRYQRHRFTTEILLGPCEYLYQVSRMKNFRLGFKTYVKIKPNGVPPPPLI